MAASKKLKRLAKNVKSYDVLSGKEPVWKGPIIDGVTQSLISEYLLDRERFYLRVWKGLAPVDSFEPRMHYGVLWHWAEKYYVAGKGWKTPLRKKAEELIKKYRFQQDQIVHWYMVCKIQFEVYEELYDKEELYSKHDYIYKEEVFDEIYSVPLHGAQDIRLRGCWDGVYQIRKGRSAGIYLQENKTKADIDEASLIQRLTLDLQTMTYLVALRQRLQRGDVAGPIKLRGVLYNVVRRPLSGGKHSIRQKKNQTLEQFYAELKSLIHNNPEHYFIRLDVTVLPEDIERFKRVSLTPILRNMIQWWYWQVEAEKAGLDRFDSLDGVHYQLPTGLYNPIVQGRPTYLDEYLQSGSTKGLKKLSSVFGELE